MKSTVKTGITLSVLWGSALTLCAEWQGFEYRYSVPKLHSLVETPNGIFGFGNSQVVTVSKKGTAVFLHPGKIPRFSGVVWVGGRFWGLGLTLSRSDDGLSWEPVLTEDSGCGAIAKAPEGPFVSSWLGSKLKLRTSSDGQSWTEVFEGRFPLDGKTLHWSPAAQKYLIAYGRGKILVSTDGQSWEIREPPTLSQAHVRQFASSGSTVLARTSIGFFLSTDGENWSPVDPEPFRASSITRFIGADRQGFYAYFGSSRVYESSDGKNWSVHAASRWRGLDEDPPLLIRTDSGDISVDDRGTIYGTDGISHWKALPFLHRSGENIRAIPSQVEWTGSEFVGRLENYVGYQFDALAASPNGIHWKIRQHPRSLRYERLFSPGNGVLLAHRISEWRHSIVISRDGGRRWAPTNLPVFHCDNDEDPFCRPAHSLLGYAKGRYYCSWVSVDELNRSGFFMSEDGENWRSISLPSGRGAPVTGAFHEVKGKVFLLGHRLAPSFLHSLDGENWTHINQNISQVSRTISTGNRMVAATREGTVFSTNGGHWKEDPSWDNMLGRVFLEVSGPFSKVSDDLILNSPGVASESFPYARVINASNDEEYEEGYCYGLRFPREDADLVDDGEGVRLYTQSFILSHPPLPTTPLELLARWNELPEGVAVGVRHGLGLALDGPLSEEDRSYLPRIDQMPVTRAPALQFTIPQSPPAGIRYRIQSTDDLECWHDRFVISPAGWTTNRFQFRREVKGDRETVQLLDLRGDPLGHTHWRLAVDDVSRFPLLQDE